LPGVGVVDCGPADNYQVGEVKLFKDGNFFLVRQPEGFLALSRWCTHLNGKVVYQQAHWRFWCPFHGAIYERSGAPIGDRPDVCPLRLNPIRFGADGRVLVDTDQVVERDQSEPGQAVLPPVAAAGADREGSGWPS
jgi:Rieske Fe-S protein